MGNSYFNGVRHHDVYAKEMNRLYQDVSPLDSLLTHHFIYYDDNDDLHPMNNASYLGFETYGQATRSIRSLTHTISLITRNNIADCIGSQTFRCIITYTLILTNG